ncbi:hypothetical protein CRUP_006674 [Coryphaenoides rupestris]|nr:hypothetical protein CRUP_006674 [Coryphaenoides rupestris]
MAASVCRCYELVGRRVLTLSLSSRSLGSSSFGRIDSGYRNRPAPIQDVQVRHASGRKGFFEGFVDNLRQEFGKNQEMKDNIKKFRDEAKRLEESDALQQARRKYKSIESETVKTSEVFKKTFGSLSETVKELVGRRVLTLSLSSRSLGSSSFGRIDSGYRNRPAPIQDVQGSSRASWTTCAGVGKNQEMKDNIKKFRDEAKRLEESDALQQARRKYGLEEVSRTDLGKKIKEGVEEAARTAKHSAETVSRGGEKLGSRGAFRAISQGVETMRKEIDIGDDGGPLQSAGSPEDEERLLLQAGRQRHQGV